MKLPLLRTHTYEQLKVDEDSLYLGIGIVGGQADKEILKQFQEQDLSLIGRIKDCIVDFSPIATPNPQVWAFGFSASILKMCSIITKGIIRL